MCLILLAPRKLNMQEKLRFSLNNTYIHNLSTYHLLILHTQLSLYPHAVGHVLYVLLCMLK